MSAKAIYEAQGKALLARELLGSAVSAVVEKTDAEKAKGALFRIPTAQVAHVQFAKETGALSKSLVTAKLDALPSAHPWLLTSKLVVKPDQLIKRRGKAGLLGLNLDWPAAKAWITERAGQSIKVGEVSGVLKTFILEPFVPHPQETEHYVCVQSVQEGDLIYFYHAGGIDVGDVDAKAKKWLVPTGTTHMTLEEIQSSLLTEMPAHAKAPIADFIRRLWHLFVLNNFTYLEINPLVLLPAEKAGEAPQVIFLDLAAKVDQTAEFESGKYWGSDLEFPAPFGRDLSKEEQYIQDLDAKTGASLKLTILNRQGRIWTMVAGGGASVVYSDAIAAHGFAHELANYGEYSGAPSETQTYEYAKTLLDLMTTGAPRSDGKVLIVGGGIANFTNVAATFKGIVRALREYHTRLQEHKVEIYVRRGGPNYQEGLKLMRKLGESLALPIHVFGPETHITAIVPLALGIKSGAITPTVNINEPSFAESMFMGGTPTNSSINAKAAPGIVTAKVSIVDSPTDVARFEHDLAPESHPWYSLFTKKTRSFVWGMQPRAVQGMLDFDHMCGRTVPSVAAIIYPFGGSHVQKFYWGAQETLLPVFTSFGEALAKFSDVDVVVNFASCRSVFSSCKDILDTAAGKIKTIAVIAEGVPERRTKELADLAKKSKVNIIGPATVGGIKPGCFKIGNTGGMIDNIVSCRLYRPGSVSYVSKSGGMSNELNNMLSRCTDGVYEGVAIGGDRYPCTTFLDHIDRFEQDPNCKMIVLLGEVGGAEEYKVAEAIKNGNIKKPVIAWCIGTCAGMFGSEVQFGHAGALANSDLETSNAKNRALKAAGALVPNTFEELPSLIGKTFNDLVAQKVITIRPEPEAPKVPIDYAWAQELGLIRKPASFVSTICDDRGQELLYAGMPISEVFKEEIGIGGVVSLLWFKRRLPSYACKFIEMVLMLTADHGPAVSGAHNTIVTARAGKDLISSLTAGLLTIGDRFGGALDGAAEQFSVAFDQGWTPQEFVDNMRKENKLIMGIGHKIKSRTNPDLRVSILTEFAQAEFPATPLLDYARQVEQITTAKKDNLILNVDGATAVLFVDLLRHCGAFTKEEAEEYVKYGTLNGLFVLGRSIGFIGHYIDQKRLKQGLYRHDWNDISYLLPDTNRVVISEQP